MVHKPTSKEKQTCFICQESFSKERLHIHNHTFNHHAWIEKIKGCEQPHTCYACNVTVIGMKSYNRHYNSKNHKLNMKGLHEHKHIDYQFNVTIQEAQSYYASGEERKNTDKCYLCFCNVPIQNWHWHVHGDLHHYKMETLKRGRTHKCWACDMITHSFGDYKKHMKTSTHKSNLEQLKRTNNTREDILMFYSAEIEEFKDVAQRPKKKKNNKPQTNVPNAQWSVQTQSVMGSSTGTQPEQQSFTAHLPMKPSADGQHPSQSVYTHNGSEQEHLTRRKALNLEKCYLCFSQVPLQHWHSHVHGYPHHYKMETLKRGRTHTCWACDVITHSLGDYKEHIKTSTHKNNLEQLKRTNNTREDILMFYSAEIEEFKDVIAPRPKENKNNVPQTNVPNAQWSFQTQSVMGSSTGTQPEQQSFTAHLPMKPSADGQHPSQSEQKQPNLRRRAYSPGDEEASHSLLNKRVCVDVPSGNVPQKASAWGLTSNANVQRSEVNARGEDPESLRGSCRFSKITTPGDVEQKETPVTPQQSHENSSSAPRVYTHNASEQEHLTRRVCDAHESTPPEHPDQLQLQKLLEQTRSSTATQRAEMEKASASEKKQKKSSRKRKKVPHTDADEDQSGQKQLDELMCLSVREEELNQALEKTSDSLFQAYAVLQKTYTHVQHLITAKQQVTSEMSSLRGKRLKILQDMKSCCGDASEIDQQVAPNSS